MLLKSVLQDRLLSTKKQRGKKGTYGTISIIQGRRGYKYIFIFLK